MGEDNGSVIVTTGVMVNDFDLFQEAFSDRDLSKPPLLVSWWNMLLLLSCILHVLVLAGGQ
jgi:hypothetical protein